MLLTCNSWRIRVTTKITTSVYWTQQFNYKKPDQLNIYKTTTIISSTLTTTTTATTITTTHHFRFVCWWLSFALLCNIVKKYYIKINDFSGFLQNVIIQGYTLTFFAIYILYFILLCLLQVWNKQFCLCNSRSNPFLEQTIIKQWLASFLLKETTVAFDGIRTHA